MTGSFNGKNGNKERTDNIRVNFRSVLRRIAAVLVASCFALTAFPAAEAAALDGAGTSFDEEIALDLYDTDGSAPAAEKKPEAVLPAEPGNYAEALAQSYKPLDGTVDITADSRFYIVADEEPGEELLETVRLMDAQFAERGIPSEEPLGIVYGLEKRSAEGDIVIRLVGKDDFNPGCDTADPKQAYRLIASDRIVIEACDIDGIYYGLISLLQMAMEKKTDKGVTLSGMAVADGPDVEERAVFLDCGRKYFSREWIENYIRRSSFQRYNTIILHFSEAEGLRFDSEVFPWLTEDIKSLSREDMTDIVKTAGAYHMKVIPSFDVPGHNKYMVKKYAKYVKKHPDFSFTYGGKTYDSNIKGFGSIANYYSKNGKTVKSDSIGIDLTSEHAVAFTNALIDDYARFFGDLGCREFDICGDEIMGWDTPTVGGETVTYANRWNYLSHWAKYAKETLGIEKGSASDTFISFINDVATRLEGKGYTVRVFNDDMDINDNQHVELKDSIEVAYWSGQDNSAKHFTEKGHKVYYCISKWCYYVVFGFGGEDIMEGKYKSVNAKNIYENWDPQSFSSKPDKHKPVTEGMNGGGYFCIWCDDPDYKNSGKIWRETELRTWANSSRLWNREVNSASSGINAAMAYEDMKAFAESMNSFPGYDGDPETKTVLTPPQVPAPSANWWQQMVDNMGL